MVAKDAPRRRLFLMRHGAVTYFAPGGRPLPPQTVPLDKAGREQAATAGRLFAAQGIRFDRVVTSGLARAVETATRVLAASGQTIALEEDARLREIEGGRLADLPEAGLREAFTGAFDGVVPDDRRFLGGESVGELFARVVPAVQALRDDPAWDTALVVAHGGVNRAILSWLLTGEARLLGGFAQSYACVNALDLGEARHDVVLRLANHEPLDPLQAATRKTTMESLYESYLQWRTRRGKPDDR